MLWLGLGACALTLLGLLAYWSPVSLSGNLQSRAVGSLGAGDGHRARPHRFQCDRGSGREAVFDLPPFWQANRALAAVALAARRCAKAPARVDRAARKAARSHPRGASDR